MKKQTSILINIPKPCSENWGMMNKTDSGRFCKSCQKHVGDYTKLSDRELIAALSKQEGSKCGRFSKTQLNRYLHITEPDSGSFFPKFLLSSLLTFLITKPLFSQQTKPVEIINTADTQQQKSTVEENTTNKTEEISDSLHLIKGKVVDGNKEGIPYAIILIKGTDYSTQSDLNGEFFLDVKDLKIQEKIVLQTSAVGYSTEETEVFLTKLHKTITVKLNVGILVGEIVEIVKPNLWQRIRHNRYLKREERKDNNSNNAD
jgi:hypothetical protein